VLLLGAYLASTKRRAAFGCACELERLLNITFTAVVLLVCVGTLVVATGVDPPYIVGPVLAMLFVAIALKGRRLRQFADLPRLTRSAVILGVVTLLVMAGSVLTSIVTAVK
jgi:hypothetical protein